MNMINKAANVERLVSIIVPYMTSKSVSVVFDSKNRKISSPTRVCSATYVSQKSCPVDCPLRNNGCYFERGHSGIQNVRLTREMNAEKRTLQELAEIEALKIDALPALGQDLRIHAGGESRNKKAAKTVGDAASRFMQRGSGIAWTYTHCWKTIKRKVWGLVQIMASIHSIEEVATARKQGYAPAMVFPKEGFPDGYKPFYVEGCSTKWIPCKEQTQKIPCTDCRLCLNADALFKANSGIAFKKH